MPSFVSLPSMILLLVGVSVSACERQAPASTSTSPSRTKESAVAESIHAFEMTSIDGDPLSLSQFEGKVVLIVNVASRCGYTPQYGGLQTLHETYAERGLVVLGVPANNFGAQEPGSDEEIKSFCSTRFNVTFPMLSKISVKGADRHPLYAYLTHKGDEVSWNFNKYLVGKDGKLLAHFPSKVRPMSAELTAPIEEALAR